MTDTSVTDTPATDTARMADYSLSPRGAGEYVGANACVSGATCRSTGERVAIKILRTPAGLSSRTLRELRLSKENEIEAMRTLRHPHIVAVREILEGEGTWIVMEHCEMDLFSFVMAQPDMCLAEADARCVVRGVVKALGYMEGVGCSHGDVKPENILIDRRQSGQPVPKLADFGACQVHGRVLRGGGKFFSYLESLGTHHYMAPEVLRLTLAKKENKEKLIPYDCRLVDVYALGATLFAMLSGRHLHPERGRWTSGNRGVLVSQITQSLSLMKKPDRLDNLLSNSNRRSDLSSAARELVRGSLVPDPLQRLKLKDVAGSEWLDEPQFEPEPLERLLETHPMASENTQQPEPQAGAEKEEEKAGEADEEEEQEKEKENEEQKEEQKEQEKGQEEEEEHDDEDEMQEITGLTVSVAESPAPASKPAPGPSPVFEKPAEPEPQQMLAAVDV